MNDSMLQDSINDLQRAISAVPPGRWGVGVSGGADSVALLLLLCQYRSSDLHVIHLDHQTRDGESARDAQFVVDLAARLGLASTIDRRSSVELGASSIPANKSARFRRARFELFRRTVKAESLNGVILAHHADDQSETILQRILRGAGPASIRGMQIESVIEGLIIVRPLLAVSASHLRTYLGNRKQPWCQDASNQSDEYLRNRVRRWLTDQPDLRDILLNVGASSHELRRWLDEHTPELGDLFAVEDLAILPLPLARHAASRWLANCGCPPAELSRHVCDQLVQMAADAATPPRHHFPGGFRVQRVRGMIRLDSQGQGTDPRTVP